MIKKPINNNKNNKISFPKVLQKPELKKNPQIL